MTNRLPVGSRAEIRSVTATVTALRRPICYAYAAGAVRASRCVLRHRDSILINRTHGGALLQDLGGSLALLLTDGDLCVIEQEIEARLVASRKAHV